MSAERRTIRKKIESALYRDRHFLKRRLNSLPPVDHNDYKNRLKVIEERLNRSLQQAAAKKNALPHLEYPEALPISSKKNEICDVIKSSQVVVITGETGSGKTTQIPKMCLEAGRGIYGKIACTQPRRIAATSLSRQLAKETRTNLGEQIGYKIRFAEQTNEETLIQFVTDGLLLAEIQRDRFLNDYDTIIIDEAHERTLNIDFLLGYLRQLLPKRPELKLIITSATIDIEKFSKAFPQVLDPKTGNYRLSTQKEQSQDIEIVSAPIISVSGRMYPVEVRYFPIDEVKEEQGDQTIIDLVQEAVEDLLTESDYGDILVFMSGEQEIKETLERLKYLEKENYSVLPLFGRLSNADQNRIFKTSGKRKIILSTNIAETSITVPRIHYVVDTGRARISQYNTRTGTQGLPVKAISQSSADQRKGRCGRIANGICVRLYSEEDFLNRNQYTTPEIQRSNLSEVILRMLDLRLGEVETFPFIDPPESAQIRSGFRTLRELGALDKSSKLTRIGKEMAALPLDPRTARMVLKAKDEKAVYPVLIIASAISCQDPRERPEDMKTQASQKHALFKSKESDLITLLNLWESYHSSLEELKSQGKMRKFCKANFLSYNRIREWRDIHSQLTMICKEKQWNTKKPDNFDYDAIHKSILAGYLTHIAKLKVKKTYQGTKNREFMLFPGSDQYQSRHQWIVAIELIETSKLFAHMVSRIDPDWLESLAGDLCKKSWLQPHWDKKTNRVVAIEKVTLFGFCLVDDRKVFYGAINREESNQIFIKEALVEGGLDVELPFFKHNKKLINEIEHEEAKIRSRNLLVDDATIEAFYAERIDGVACLDDLKKIIKKNSGDKFLCMTKEILLKQEVPDTAQMFPSYLKVGGQKCKLQYQFDPGHERDGVTIIIPKKLLGSIREEEFEYLVPGLLKEKIFWLLKNLPKEERKKLVPLPEKVEKVWNEMISLTYSTEQPQKEISIKGDFFKDLTEALFKVTKVHIQQDSFKQIEIPDYLKMNFGVKSDRSRRLEYSRNLQSFTSKQKVKQKDEWTNLIAPFERWDIENWDFEPLMQPVELVGKGDIPIWGYRALVSKNKDLMLTVQKSEEEARESCLQSVPVLLEKQISQELAWLYQELRFPPEALYRFHYLWKSGKTLDDSSLEKKYNKSKAKAQRDFHDSIQSASYQMVCAGLCEFDEIPIFTEEAFSKKLQALKLQLAGLGTSVVNWIGSTLDFYHQVLIGLQQNELKLDPLNKKAIKQELNSFFTESCLQEIPLEQWKHCARIFKCYLKRIDRSLVDSKGELDRLEKVKPYQDKAKSIASLASLNVEKTWALKRFRWMLEEFKVSQFAQSLSTAFPISEKRMDKFLAKYFGDLH